MININTAIEEIKYIALSEGFEMDTVETFEKACKGENITQHNPALTRLLKNSRFKQIAKHVIKKYNLDSNFIENQLNKSLSSI